jgi:hypothetical protein
VHPIKKFWEITTICFQKSLEEKARWPEKELMEFGRERDVVTGEELERALGRD